MRLLREFLGRAHEIVGALFFNLSSRPRLTDDLKCFELAPSLQGIQSCGIPPGLQTRQLGKCNY
jgi:hypothetical protein